MEEELDNFPCIRGKLKSTRRSSNELGPCEVCGKHCSETFISECVEPFEHEGKMLYAHRWYALGHEQCLLRLDYSNPTPRIVNNEENRDDHSSD